MLVSRNDAGLVGVVVYLQMSHFYKLHLLSFMNNFIFLLFTFSFTSLANFDESILYLKTSIYYTGKWQWLIRYTCNWFHFLQKLEICLGHMDFFQKDSFRGAGFFTT